MEVSRITQASWKHLQKAKKIAGFSIRPVIEEVACNIFSRMYKADRYIWGDSSRAICSFIRDAVKKGNLLAIANDIAYRSNFGINGFYGRVYMAFAKLHPEIVDYHGVLLSSPGVNYVKIKDVNAFCKFMANPAFQECLQLTYREIGREQAIGKFDDYEARIVRFEQWEGNGQIFHKYLSKEKIYARLKDVAKSTKIMAYEDFVSVPEWSVVLKGDDRTVVSSGKIPPLHMIDTILLNLGGRYEFWGGVYIFKHIENLHRHGFDDGTLPVDIRVDFDPEPWNENFGFYDYVHEEEIFWDDLLLV